MNGKWVTVVCLVFLCGWLFGGCDCDDAGDDDDNDNNNDNNNDSSPIVDDDTSPDDDDSLPDDDDTDSDDDTVDDDNDNDNDNDDSTVDDDADDDDDDNDDDNDDDDVSPDPYPLLLIGAKQAAGGANPIHTSWRQTADGWVEYPIPLPVGLPTESGPTFLLEGRVGYGVWNSYWGLYYYPWAFNLSIGHEWLIFDEANGWRLDPERPPTAPADNVRYLFAASEADVWAYSQFFLVWGNIFDPTTIELNRLVRYENGEPVVHLRQGLRTLFFVSPTAGMAASDEHLFTYEGGQWLTHPLPAGFENGMFSRLWLTDMENGYANFYSYEHGTQLAALIDGEWSVVPPPAGCENVGPANVYTLGERGFVHGGTGAEVKVWELRDGEWFCRTLGDGFDSIGTYAALMLRSGHSYFQATDYGQTPWLHVLFDVTDDAVTTVDLPEDLAFGEGLYGLGPTAPKYWLNTDY